MTPPSAWRPWQIDWAQMEYEHGTREQIVNELARAYQRITQLELLFMNSEDERQRLTQERQLLRTLIDNLPDPIYFKDRDSRFVMGNRAVGHLMGVTTPAKVIGKTDFDFYPHELASQYYSDEQELIQTGQALIDREEPIINQATGERGWLSTSKVPLVDDQGRIVGLVGIGRDITERKLFEEALRHSRQQVLDILESISDAFCALDRQWRFTYVNQKAEQLLQRRREELLNRSLWEEFPEAVSLLFYEEYQRAIREQVTVEFEEYYEPLQKWMAVHAYPYSDGLSIYFEDISDRKRVEDELQQYRHRLEELVEQRTARLKTANKKLRQEISRRQQAEAGLRRYAERLKILQEIDRSILSAQSPEAIAHAALRHIRRLVPCQQAGVLEFDFETGEVIVLAAQFNGEMTMARITHSLAAMTPGEEYPWHQVQVVEDIQALRHLPPLIYPEQVGKIRAYINVPMLAAGELIGVLNLNSERPGAFATEHVEIAREVANQLAVALQQARLHQQVQRYATELEQRISERTAELQEIIAELEAFTYSVSHDLRAPLRAMHGFARALLEDYADGLDATGQDYTRRIAGAAKRMDTLIQDLLMYGRISRTHLYTQTVNLKAVVADALEQLAEELKERQARVQVGESLPGVMGHHTTLVQVVTNLLANAVKFVPPGSQPQVQVWAESRGGLVRLWVEDNGIGVEPEHRERIFRIFERLHGMETYPGTGIGLAFVSKAVARMGGRVGLESTAGQGSQFWLELPAARPGS